MNFPAHKPPAAPGTGHRDGCTCPACVRWRYAVTEAARLKAANLQKAMLAGKGAAVGRKEAKAAAAHEGIARDVQYTARKVEEIRRASGPPDPRTEMFLRLRREGKGFAAAMTEVDRAFGAMTTNDGGDDHGKT